MGRRAAPGTPYTRTVAAIAVASCFVAHTAFANPTGPTVVNGTAAIHQQGNLLQITNSPNAILNWQSFSIGASEITRFIQQSASSAVLNRVISQNPSTILGALQSNGRVFLINPNGILFGAGAQVDVAGLVASTLNLSNADFLAGRLKFTEVPGAGSIVNQGNINAAQGGQVYLVGPSVTNSGVITTPKGEVILAAGNSVELVNPGTPNLRVEITAPDNQAVNLGQIVADAGRVGIYAGLIKHSGTIRADSAQVTEDGRIILAATKSVTLNAGSVTTANGPNGGSITVQSGGTTLVSGSVEAKGSEGKGGTVQVLGNQVGLIDNASVNASGETGGGTVLVGGDFQGKPALSAVEGNPIQNAFRTYVGPDASIKADAISSGDGGKVIVWSEDVTRFYGTISARGGASGGNGGFVEVSGKDRLDFAGLVNTSAANGRAGTLLLDPQDLTISDTVATNNSELNAGVPTGEPAGSIFFVDTSGSNFTITDEVLEAQTGNIVLQATRDITVNTGLSGGLNLINQGTGERVVFQAGRHITIGSPLTTNGAAIILEADSPHAPTSTSSDGRKPADGIGQLSIQQALNSGGGAITLIGGGNPIRGLNNQDLSSTRGGIVLDATVDAGAGGINIALSGNAPLGIGVTGQLTHILGSPIAYLKTTGALVLGTATTGGTDGQGTGAQTLTADSISNIYNGSAIALSPASGSSFQLIAGSGGILLSQPLATFQNTTLSTTGPLTINQTVSTSNHDLTISAGSVTIGSSGTLNYGSGTFTCGVVTGICPGGGSQIFWDGGAGTLNWFDQNNWSANLVPTAAQDVTIGSGFGAILISGAAAVAKSLIANSSLQLSSGSLALTNASNFSDAFTLAGSGSLQGTGGVTVSGSNGSLNWTGGTMAGGGSFLLGGGRNGTLSGSLTLDRLFQNSGTLTLSGATINGTGSITNGALVTAASSTSNVVNTLISNKVVEPTLGTTTLGTIQVNGLLTAANFPTNDGIIDIASGATLSTNGNALTNAATGTIVGTGTLNLASATLTNNGSIRAGTSPAKLTIVGNLNLSSTSVIDVELGGTTQGVGYDWIEVTGSASLNGTMNVTEVGGFQVSPGNNFQVISCGVLCSGSFAALNSPVDVSLTPMTNPTNFALNADGVINRWVGTSGAWDVTGNWSRGVPVSSQDVIIGGPITETVTVSTGTQAARTLTSQENLTISGGSLSLGSMAADASTINGAFTLSGGALQAAGTVTVNGAFNWSGGTLAGSGSLIPTGPAVDLTGSGARMLIGLTLSANDLNLGGGSLTLQSGTLNASGTTTILSGASMVAQGGTFNAAGRIIDVSGTFEAAGGTVTAGTMNVQSGGLLRGVGTVSANVNNVAGTVAPGASPGVLTINGNYVQGPAGVLAVEIGGTAPGTFDQLVVTGNATLDGTLGGTLVNGFAPTPGDTFPVIRSGGTVNGAFAAVNYPTGWGLAPQYLLSIVNVAVPLPSESIGQIIVAAADQSTTSPATTAPPPDEKKDKEKSAQKKKPMCTGGSSGGGGGGVAVTGGGGRCTTRGCT